MGRLGIDVNLDELGAIGRDVDLMVHIKRSGTGYMETCTKPAAYTAC